jgi:L-histidine N-alpha-methyltransferase
MEQKNAMNSLNPDPRVSFSNFLVSSQPEIQVKQVIENITAIPRSIASKYLYDETGSMLYNQITQLPDYYLTHLEMLLIDAFAKGNTGSIYNSEIVDLGCGNEKKVCLLLDVLDSLDSITYTALDVSVFALKETASNLVKRYPDIHVHCIAADFMTQLHVLPAGTKKRIYCFWGSTLGNLSRRQRIHILKVIGEMMNSDDQFLLGVDLIKQKTVMEQAYNDSLNITARFNRNILNVVNSIIKTDFNPSAFEHVAFYNEVDSRIEMHLKSTHTMTVTTPYLPFPIKLDNGEMIHTENSHKFTIAMITNEIESAGLHVKRVNMDSRNQYSLILITR